MLEGELGSNWVLIGERNACNSPCNAPPEGARRCIHSTGIRTVAAPTKEVTPKHWDWRKPTTHPEQSRTQKKIATRQGQRLAIGSRKLPGAAERCNGAAADSAHKHGT